LPELPPSDSRWAIRFGECIYNLRAGLDYLVFALAHLDSGVEQADTQFPICSSLAAFNNLLNPKNPKRA
jgi:hypothetical protein